MTAQPNTIPAAPQPKEASAPPTTPPPPKVSVQDYLESERKSRVRREYVDGEILAMAGETPTHNRIARNICVRLERAFEDRPCETFIENIRVRVTPTQYRYPDVVALCGDAHFDANKPPCLLNPTVIIEVLSPSTEAFDREEKFIEYRQVETVTDYVLVSQDQILVIHYSRVTPSQWVLNVYTALTDTLTFPTLEVSLILAEVYRKINFAPSDLPETTKPSSEEGTKAGE